MNLKITDSELESSVDSSRNSILRWGGVYLRLAWQLGKLPLCLLISCSACFGAILAEGRLSLTTIYVGAGVLFLAAGGATLNSVQEIDSDALMRRTARRPLVVRALSRQYGLMQAIFLVIVGFVLLAMLQNTLTPLLLGGAALLLYNGVYTRLKKVSLLALLPGAVCGATPPLIGWTAAGGQVFSHIALMLFFLFFLWQIPHFYLILLRHRSDYLETEQPNMLRALSEGAVRKMSCVWIIALGLVMMMFAVTPYAYTEILQLLVIANGAVSAVFICCGVLFQPSGDGSRTQFIALNVMLLCHMVILIAGALLRP